MINCLTILLFITTVAQAQDSSSLSIKKTELNGYVKSLQTLSFSKDFHELLTTNLLHNRINWKWTPGKYITITSSLRNRLIWGDEVKVTPHFAKQLRNNNEWANLSVNWIETEQMVLHTNVERLMMEYKHKRWTIQAGRQRINWSITTTWNPNDIFNTYNFLDFDYEERPGSDAVRTKYMITDFSKIEIAFTPGKQKNITAVNYFFNKNGYDIQLNAGYYQNRWTTGAGWAGNIKEAGFKGEIQFYTKNSSGNHHLNLCVESDYSFRNGWYLNGSYLYNSEGIKKQINRFDTLSFEISPYNLMPTSSNFLVTTSKAFTPLLSGRLSILYAPGTNLLIVLPALRYNLAGNLDADFIGQSFFAELKKFEPVNHRFYIRLKWNF